MDSTLPPDAGPTPIAPPPAATAAAPFGAPPAPGDQPIGAPQLPQAMPRARRRQGLAVSGSGLLVIAGIVIRVFLFTGHSSESPVAKQYRTAVSNFIDKEDGLAPTLAGALPDTTSLATLKAGVLRDFDTAVGALQVPDSAKSDRDALITADHTYESDLDAVAAGDDTVDLDGAQQGHIDAANRLAHDLGMGDVLYLSTSASSTGG